MAFNGFNDYFKNLGNSRNATDRAIKNAFRKLSWKSHPIWKLKALDTYADLSISLDVVALGVNISVALPQGSIIY